MRGISFNYKLLIGFFTVICLFSLLFAYPILDFTNPTETNNSYINTNWAEVNLTVDMNESLDTFKLNWNGTNYTFYDSNLVLSLNFNNNSNIGENSTLAVDISEYGNNGTISGASWSLEGKFGGSMYFDGGDKVSCADPAEVKYTHTDSFTWSAWIKTTNTDGQYIIQRYRGYQPQISFGLNSTGHAYFQLRCESDIYSTVRGTSSINDGNWHYVVGVRNVTEDKLYIYVDSVCENNITDSTTGDLNSFDGYALTIGYPARYSSNPFKGYIDKVRIYNGALSSDEIFIYYQSELSKYNSTQYRFYNNMTSLTEGSYTYYGWSNDTTGNENTSEIRYLDVDFTPSFNFISPSEGSTEKFAIINLTIEEPDLNNFTFNWNGTNYTFYDSNLVLSLNFNNNSNIGENSTLAVDISEYGNNGTISGAVWNTSGKYGSALSFDGIDDNININSNCGITGYPFTLSGWVNSNKDKGTIVSLADKDDTNIIYSIGCWIGDNISLSARNGVDIYEAVSITPMNDSIWHYIVGVFNSNTDKRLYVDGNNVANLTTSVSLNTAIDRTRIGVLADQTPGNYLNGTIDKVRIYNRSLSSDEISMHYNSEFQKYNSTHWGFYNNITNLIIENYTYYAWANDTSSHPRASDVNNFSVYDINISFSAQSIADNSVISNSNIIVDANTSEGIDSFIFQLDDYNYTISSYLLSYFCSENSSDSCNLSFEYKIRTRKSQYDLILDSDKYLYPERDLIFEISFENDTNYGEDYGGGSRIRDYSNKSLYIPGSSSVDYVDGIVGKAIDFDGNKYISVKGSDAFNIADEFTIMYWINKKVVHSGNQRPLYNNINNWNFYYSSSGYLKFQCYVGSSTHYITVGNTSVGDWKLVAVTYNNSLASNNIKTYLNGALKETQTTSGSITYNDKSSLVIGSAGSHSHVTAILDEIKYYNRALTQEEIQKYYDSCLNNTYAEKTQYNLNISYYDLNGTHNYTLFACKDNICASTEQRNITINTTGSVTIDSPNQPSYMDLSLLNLTSTVSSTIPYECIYSINNYYNYTFDCNYSSINGGFLINDTNNISVYLMDYGKNIYTNTYSFITNYSAPNLSDFIKVNGYYFEDGEGNPHYFSGCQYGFSVNLYNSDEEFNQTIYDILNYCGGTFRWFMNTDFGSGDYYNYRFDKLDKIIYYTKLNGGKIIPVLQGSDYRVIQSLTKQEDERRHMLKAVTRYNQYTGTIYLHEPTIMAWDIKNEPECGTGTCSCSEMDDWGNTQLDYLYSIDPTHLRFVGTIGDNYNCRNLDRFGEMGNCSFSNFHYYYGESASRAKSTYDYTKQGLAVEKPVIIGETNKPEDSYLKIIFFHNRFYPLLLAGGAGSIGYEYQNNAWVYTFYKDDSELMGFFRDYNSISNQTWGSFENSSSNIVQCNNESAVYLLCEYHGKDTGEYGKLMVYNPYDIITINYNPGFEYSDLREWYNTSQFESTTEDYKFGYRSLKINATDSGTKCNVTITSLSTNTNYTLTFWGKGNASTRVKLRTTSDIELGNTSLYTNNSWAKYSFSINSSSNTEIVLDIIDEETGVSYIDEFRLFRTDNITTVNITSDEKINMKDLVTDTQIVNNVDSYLLTIDPHDFFVMEIEEGIKPLLTFKSPTEANDSIINTNWTEINITIDEINLDNFKFNWNGTNYTFYDDSLVLAMNFNNNSNIGENSTHAVDISEYGNNGTLNGDVSWSSEGKFGGAMSFDGTNDYVTIPYDSSLHFGWSPFSIEMWFKTSTNKMILDKWGGGGNDDRYFISMSSGKIRFFTASSYTYKNLYSVGANYDDGNWHHLVVTRSGSTGKIYVDGVQDDSGTAIHNAKITQDGIGFRLGTQFDGGSDFNGIIDEFRMYNKVLSENEILIHYQSEFQKYNSTQWRFYNNVTSISDETYTYYAWANDTYGNENQTETRTLTVSGCLPPTDGTWEVNKNCTLTDETVSTSKTIYLNSPYVYLLENTTFDIGGLVIELGGKLINDVSSNININ